MSELPGLAELSDEQLANALLAANAMTLVKIGNVLSITKQIRAMPPEAPLSDEILADLQDAINEETHQMNITKSIRAELTRRQSIATTGRRRARRDPWADQ